MSSDGEDRFAQHWERRHETEPQLHDPDADTPARVERDLVFVVRIEGGTRDGLADVADSLGDLDGVRAPPPEYLHVTVKRLGEATATPEADDELPADDADALMDAAAGALSRGEPFDLAFPRLNCFPAVVFGEAHGDAWPEADGADALDALHRRLCDVAGMPTYRFDGDDYTPHASLAHFETEAGFERAIAWAEENRDLDVPVQTVEAIELADVRPQPRGYPEIETVRRYRL